MLLVSYVVSNCELFVQVEHIGLDTSEYFDEHGIDHLLDASRIVMFEQMEQLVSQQKQSHCTPGSGPTALLPCQLTADDQLSIVPLASALFTYLGYVSDIPKADIPNSGIEWIPDVSLDCLKVVLLFILDLITYLRVCCMLACFLAMAENTIRGHHFIAELLS